MTYAMHEILDVHEMTAFKTVCLTKAKTMRGLVTDEELKQILQEDVDLSTRQLKELKDLLGKAKQYC